MEISYAISHRRYESRPPGLTVLVYASDGPGTVLSADTHSMFSHLFYVVPVEELSLRELEQIESSIQERWSRPGIRYCEFAPQDPRTREQIIDDFRLQ